MMTNNFLDFFWSHILKRGPDECWEWTGHVSIYGYGTYNGLVELLGTNRCSRQAYILTKGEIPPGLQVLHRCDNRKCCNPKHLRLGTHQENMDDMTQKGREAHHGVSQPGSMNGSSVLTEEQVILILKDPRTLKPISQEYVVSKTRISQIKRRLAWRHLA